MLTLTFLGTGSAFAKRNFHSNALVEVWSKGPGLQEQPDDTLLIDFGGTGPLALDRLRQQAGFEYLTHNGVINYPAIRKIFVTHQHADHIGGLEELALMNKFVHASDHEDNAFKPQLISASSVLVNLWDTSLKGGLCASPGRYTLLQDFFFIKALDDRPIGTHRFHMLKRYECETFPTDHLQINHKYDWPSYGLYLRDRETDETVFFSGDTRFDYPTYATMLQQARFCFHDVQLIHQPAPVHALIDELRTLPDAIKRKTYLYHYSDDWDAGPFDFVDEEFAGFAVPGKRYTLFD